MLAARAVSQDAHDPLAGLDLGEVPEPQDRPGWTRVRVAAATINPHDVWTLRGVGHPADRIPMTLGCDAAGTTEDGRDVIVHCVFGDPAAGGGDITLDPGRHLLSERVDGSLAEQVLVPSVALVDKPAELTFEEAACLPVAWATAYRMLFTRAGVRPGDRILVQGAAGGVASAAIALASRAGCEVYATARSDAKRDFALAQGAVAAVEPGARLPERVDVVVDSVGKATWSHSMKSLRPGGTIVTCGATTGDPSPAELSRIFYLQHRVIGSTASTKEELESLVRMLVRSGLRPAIDSVVPLVDVRAGFERLIAGDALGKIVVVP